MIFCYDDLQMKIKKLKSSNIKFVLWRKEYKYYPIIIRFNAINMVRGWLIRNLTLHKNVILI